MKYGVLAIALLVAGCGSTMPDVRPLSTRQVETSPFARAYQMGKANLLADRAGLAIVMFEKALAIDPLSVAALNALGTAYDELHRPDVARTFYVKALSIEPGSADTLNNMAVSAAMAGDGAAARELFARAAHLDPANSTIRDNMQIATTVPRDRVASVPDMDAGRPRLERSGFSEFTLTIPSPGIKTQTLPALTGALPQAPTVASEPPRPAQATGSPTGSSIWRDFAAFIGIF
jgi:tetratricopeptide (TPR) repeat protein